MSFSRNAGSIKVAMRIGSSIVETQHAASQRNELGDHSLVSRDTLGSNAITTSSSGVRNTEIRYMPWGTTRSGDRRNVMIDRGML